METPTEAPALGVSRALTTLERVASLLNEEVSNLGADLDAVMTPSDPCCDGGVDNGADVCPLAGTINTAITSLEKSLEMVRDFRSRLDL